MKFEIKHRYSGSVLFSLECGSLKLCVEAAVKSGAYLRGAYLRGADLGGAELGGAYLRGAYLRGANLGGAYLRGAYLRGANLGGADLRGAYLRGADLRGADLRGAYLRGAYLGGAYLGGADLGGAELGGATGCAPELVNPLLMLLDQPGKIRAYKLVNAEGVGPFNGGIKYEVGKHYEVKDANTDPTEDCGAGINVATLPWCLKEWQEGYSILIVEHEAKDIAAIPNYSDGKYRLHRCDVVAVKELDYARIFPKAKKEAEVKA